MFDINKNDIINFSRNEILRSPPGGAHLLINNQDQAWCIARVE